VLVVATLALAYRGAGRFVRDSTRFDRADLRWFVGWPAAAFTGRFAPHRGRYDPGQRVLNMLLPLGLTVLVTTGIGLALLHGGPAFAILDRVHRVATYPVTGLILGHILVGSGLLPGYRGVWRSMHLGGRLSTGVARRLWPAWTHRTLHEDRDEPADGRVT
jgi:cytochrome b subunit of formate dehydrogenase